MNKWKILSKKVMSLVLISATMSTFATMAVSAVNIPDDVAMRINEIRYALTKTIPDNAGSEWNKILITARAILDLPMFETSIPDHVAIENHLMDFATMIKRKLNDSEMIISNVIKEEATSLISRIAERAASLNNDCRIRELFTEAQELLDEPFIVGKNLQEVVGRLFQLYEAKEVLTKELRNLPTREVVALREAEYNNLIEQLDNKMNPLVCILSNN